LLDAVPGLDRLALLTGEQVVNIGSQDMTTRSGCNWRADSTTCWRPTKPMRC
jgi:L-asparaginase/Glu-tRNA(Gln) amidotransferase subunit D